MAGYDYAFYSNVWHEDTPEYREATIDAQRALLAPLLPLSRGRALDIGCGPGFTVIALQRLGFDAEGTEADASELDKCKTYGVPVTESNDIGSFAVGRPGAYDVITLLNVLEHIPHEAQIEACRGILSMLRPGGRLIVEVPNATSPVASHWLYQDWTHTNAFTTVSLNFVLLNAGFVDIEYVPRFAAKPRLRPRSIARWLTGKTLRAMWRAVLVAEIGNTDQARQSPLDLNLLAVTSRPRGANRAEGCR